MMNCKRKRTDSYRKDSVSSDDESMSQSEDAKPASAAEVAVVAEPKEGLYNVCKTMKKPCEFATCAFPGCKFSICKEHGYGDADSEYENEEDEDPCYNTHRCLLCDKHYCWEHNTSSILTTCDVCRVVSEISELP